jgi:hypothetical protein
MIFIFSTCSDINNVGDPSVPGIVRVVLQSDPDDTEMEILGETIPVSENDSMGVNVFQGKAWSVDDNYAILFPSVHHYFQDQFTLNILKIEDGTYLPYVVFESFVPAGNYNSISMGLDGLHLMIGVYSIPLTLPPDDDLIITFEGDYNVEEYKVTEIIVRLKPFASMTRFRDTYVFERVADIHEINYYDKSEYDRVVEGLPYIINPNDPWRP